MHELGFKLGPELSPIVSALLHDDDKPIAFWNGLLQQGVYVNLMLPPATPNGGSLLRCSVSAAHTEEQIDRIYEAFASQKVIRR